MRQMYPLHVILAGYIPRFHIDKNKDDDGAGFVLKINGQGYTAPATITLEGD